MYIQVIQAKVADEAGLRRQMERWQEELRPGATGWLGTTAGITDDGRFIALARFESESAAQANSDRPEQGAWWSEISKCLDGEADFLNCTDAQPWGPGGSDDAGFVQVMTGQSTDYERMKELMGRNPDSVRADRPEILGGMTAGAPDGRYVAAFYFTDEQSAREGEQKEPPEDVRADMEEGMALMGDVTYFDLRDPILASAN